MPVSVVRFDKDGKLVVEQPAAATAPEVPAAPALPQPEADPLAGWREQLRRSAADLRSGITDARMLASLRRSVPDVIDG